MSAIAPVKSLVFIDASHDPRLINGLVPGTEALVLDSDRDGIEQITTVLHQHPGIANLHIVSQSASSEQLGELSLGNSILNLKTLPAYEAQLQSWRSGLSAEAKIRLYGGNLPQDEQGRQVMQQLAQWTGAAIAHTPNVRALSLTLKSPLEGAPTAPAAPYPAADPANSVTCHADAGFQDWLRESGGSLAVSTYQAGKLALVGWHGQQMTLLLRQFDKPMGMALQGNRLALATRHEIMLFANAPTLAHGYLEDQPGRYDALYLPRASYFTNDLNVHDLAWGDDGLWMVSTRFNCLSSLSQEFSFVPRWQPAFISEVVPGDRCHLNGLAMVDGKPRYVTAIGETNTVGGWRANKAKGGILIDVATNEILVRGLSMPHSPVWHNGVLWLLNAGTGELLRGQPSGETEVVCGLPGFLRGMCCVGDYALVGLSQIREQHIFGELPVQERYDQLLCGVAVIDLRSGNRVGLLEFQTGCQELYGIQFLAASQSPNLLSLAKPETQQAVTAPEFAYWIRPSAQVSP